MLDSGAIELFTLSERWKLRRAIGSGPPYRPSHNSIIIDITTLCNRNCIDCNRSVGQDQAMSKEHMSLAQINRFVEQSVAGSRHWERIDIEGGEPTLHPDFFAILARLLEYRREHSPGTNIRVLTNGYGDKVNKVIEQLSGLGVDVYNSRKTSAVQEGHCAFNKAPCDLEQFAHEDFSQGCHLPAAYGLGLTRGGYYPHPVCGGIDRVFGFDIGRKELPDISDPMTEHFERLCRYCGFYLFSRQIRSSQEQLSMSETERGQKTESWYEAYREYWKNRQEVVRGNE